MGNDGVFEKLVNEIRVAGIKNVEQFVKGGGASPELIGIANRAKIRGEKGTGDPLEAWVGALLIETITGSRY